MPSTFGMSTRLKLECEPELLASVASIPVQGHAHPHDHAVQFTDDEAFLATVGSEFLARGLSSNQPVIVIATPSHRRPFIKGMRGIGGDRALTRSEEGVGSTFSLTLPFTA